MIKNKLTGIEVSERFANSLVEGGMHERRPAMTMNTSLPDALIPRLEGKRAMRRQCEVNQP
jgi:hypothetical protein